MDTRNVSYGRMNNQYAANSGMYGSHYTPRPIHSHGYGVPANNMDLAGLAHGFSGINLASAFIAQNKAAISPSTRENYANPGLGADMAALYSAAGPYTCAAAFSPQVTQNGHSYTQHAVQCMQPLAYHHYPPQETSPIPHGWAPSGGAVTDVPTLVTPRRDSISSTENDQPSTPSYAGYNTLGGTGLTINRSPSLAFTQGTPSPGSVVTPFGIHTAKRPSQSDVSPRIRLLTNQEPAIPRAIPAPSSPLKPLDRALENQRGETNVYIRGLLPETTDEQLESWGSRFGDVKSSKSIIDMGTGLCKGFGFVKYHNYEDAENCIRGFHFLGYEVSFARESFYSKLKTFADEKNTNLYVSNLPKTMNEHELANLFGPHKVCSTRILRDHKSGHGRGVGFARFENRSICEEVIKTYSNHTIKSNGEEMQIQIRYADTQEQKALKQQTQAARQFRSAEYEFATQVWRQGRFAQSTDGSPDARDGTMNDFESYLEKHSGQESPDIQRWGPSTGRSVPGPSPLGMAIYNRRRSPDERTRTTHESDRQSVVSVGSCRSSVISSTGENTAVVNLPPAAETEVEV